MGTVIGDPYSRVAARDDGPKPPAGQESNGTHPPSVIGRLADFPGLYEHAKILPLRCCRRDWVTYLPSNTGSPDTQMMDGWNPPR
jgi:hypothetical protein